MYINLDRALVFLLVMLRMTGMLVFNPIFSRTNVPNMIKAGLAFVLAITVTTGITFPPLPDVTLYTFFYLVLKEMAVGLISGLVLQMFMSVLVVGGEIIDMQIGLGMSKVMDPSTNMQVSVTAQLLNVMFIVGFFQSNAHLTLIRMTVKTFDILPLGELVFNRQGFMDIPELIVLIFLLSVKLCLPMIVVEVIVTFAVGMIMRVIPQINIFVLNIQIKLLVGFTVMVMMVPALSAFCENMVLISFDHIQRIWGDFT